MAYDQVKSCKFGSSGSYSYSPMTRESQTQRKSGICTQNRRSEKESSDGFIF